MNVPAGKKLREALADACVLPAPRSSRRFWDDFRARAELTVQESAARPRAVGVPGYVRPLGACLAAAAAVLAAISLLLPGGGNGGAPVLSKVDRVDVFVECDSVMIVEDTENRGTVIWLASAEPRENGS